MQCKTQTRIQHTFCHFLYCLSLQSLSGSELPPPIPPSSPPPTTTPLPHPLHTLPPKPTHIVVCKEHGDLSIPPGSKRK